MISEYYEVHVNGKRVYCDFDRFKVEIKYQKLIANTVKDDVIIVRVTTASDIIKYNKDNKIKYELTYSVI